MQKSEGKAFSGLISSVFAFYKQDFSDFAATVWWEAMKAYSFEAVEQALQRHCMNPDTGQWMPKPADVVKMLGGTTLDAALVAWSKVDRALRTVGTYQTVIFDDALIHRVLQDMGGWVPLGAKNEDEWPFVAKEFQNRYRGYAMRSERPEYLPTMIGIAEANNNKGGFGSQNPIAIGDKQKCMLVFGNGNKTNAIGIEQMSIKNNMLKLVK